MSFGQWYEEKKAEEGGGNSSQTSSWFDLGLDTDQTLPLFNSETMQSLSWDNMKSTMEAQMPKKILGMGYQQRFKVFCGLLFLSALFFALAFFVGMPMIAVRPQKFALSFTMGSLTFMGSFGILTGPMEHLKGMFTRDRAVFTTAYLGSIFMTLYCTFTVGGISGYVAVGTASAVQLIALLWYLISFIPGGTTGLRYLGAVMLQFLKPVIVVCARFQAMCLAKCCGCLTRYAMSSRSST